MDRMNNTIYNCDKISKPKPSEAQVREASMLVDECVGNKDSDNKGGDAHRQKRKRERRNKYKAKKRRECRQRTPEVDTENERLKKEVESLRMELKKVKKERDFFQSRVKILNGRLDEDRKEERRKQVEGLAEILSNNSERGLLLDKLGGMKIRAHNIRMAIKEEIEKGMKPKRTGRIKAEHQELMKGLRSTQEESRLTKVQSQREGTASYLEIQGIQAKREVGIKIRKIGMEYTNGTAKCKELLEGSKGEIMEGQQILMREALKIGLAIGEVWEKLVEQNQPHILASIPKEWDRLRMAEGNNSKFLKHLLDKIDGMSEIEPRKKELKSQYSAVMAKEGIRGFLCQIQSEPEKGEDIELVTGIRTHDFRSLLLQNWINDTVMQCYLNMLARERKDKMKVFAHDSTFWGKYAKHGHKGVARRTSGIDILGCEVVFIPICQNQHWTLIEIRPHDRRVRCYNSMNDEGNSDKLDVVRRYLEEEQMDKKGQAAGTEHWSFTSPKNVPRQTNMNDCGVFTMMAAQAVIDNKEPRTRADDIPYHRLRILMSLREGAILRGPVKAIPLPSSNT